MDQEWEALFASVQPTGSAQETVILARLAYQELARKLQELLPPGRSKQIVLTKIQESYMWAVRSAVENA